MLWLAGLKTAVGTLALLLLAVGSRAALSGVNTLRLVDILFFAGAAGLLLVGGRRDRRAVILGGTFLLAASSYGSTPLADLAETSSGLPAEIARLLRYLDPDAFLPLFLWLFFRDFPHSQAFGHLSRSVPRVAIRLSAVAGLALFALDASAAFASPEWSERIAGPAVTLLFWGVVSALGLPALVFALWRARTASRTEKRRMRIFLLGLTIGCGPMFLAFVLAALWPAFGRLLSDPQHPWRLGLVFRALLLLVPLATTYAVLVQHVLDVRLVLRKAIRYGLARYSVLTAMAIPFGLVLVYLLRHRDQPLGELASPGQVLLLAGLIGLGLVLLRGRGGLLELIDRRFFREQYDARQILMDLVGKSRLVNSRWELADLLRLEVDRALHLDRAAVLFVGPESDCLQSPQGTVRPLSRSSLLAGMLGGSSEPMDVDLERSSSPLRHLPEEEQHWLADGAFRLLTPLTGFDGALIGVLGLGEKRSELGFSAEDRSLLGVVAASAAVTLQKLPGASPEVAPAPREEVTAATAPSAEELSGECPGCRAVYPWGVSRCDGCDRDLHPMALPHILLGKYRLERRIGAGGMGVVYRATDLALGRPVAVKTLPKTSPERSLRLRREARAMAAISHPHLALVYGVETWRGVPLLLMEYLSGGSLASRLAGSGLPVTEVIELGIALASLLERAHAAGILHRDIKPSNVGYTDDRVPKLLDFGLARILAEIQGDQYARGVASHGTTLSMPAGPDWSSGPATTVVGTPAYLAPEAIRGESPGPSFDLWGLALVLYEALTGCNPFKNDSLSATLDCILSTDAPDIHEVRPDCPEPLADLLTEALSRDPSHRPGTARAVRGRLEKLTAKSAA